jgi:glutaredoxin-like protein NrdH
MAVEHVAGKNSGKVMLYALSTCPWCKKTRKLLEDLGVEYDYDYVDLETGQAQQDVMEKVRKLNPDESFPTMLIGGKKIIGFKEEDIRAALK